MADDEPVAAATETSPLLGEAARPEPAPSTSGGAENGAAEPDDGARREGMPEVAVKMHLLIPAVGIGVSCRRELTRDYRSLLSAHGSSC